MKQTFTTVLAMTLILASMSAFAASKKKVYKKTKATHSRKYQAKKAKPQAKAKTQVEDETEEDN